MKATSNECQVLLQAIEQSRSSFEIALKGGLDGIRTEMNANATVTNDHLKRLNGKVAEHEKVANDFRDFKIDYAHNNKSMAWVKKNWGFLLIGLVALIAVVDFLYKMVGVDNIINAVK